MKRCQQYVALSIILVLLFALTSCGSSREKAIKSLVKSSLDIQYGEKSGDLESVYTEDFISRIDGGFYKDALAPYSIVDDNYDFMETLQKVDNELVVAVWVGDQQGRYFQVVHIVKESTKYVIDYIEYDI